MDEDSMDIDGPSYLLPAIPFHEDGNASPAAAPPSSGARKRTFDAYAADLAQTNTHWPQDGPPQAPSPPRRIGGMLTTLYYASRGVIASIWGYITGRDQTEIVAIETNSSGNKRRAIEAEISPKTLTKQLPGSFPEVNEADIKPETVPQQPATASQKPVTQLETPPDSRPTSSQGHKKHDSPMAGQIPAQAPPQVPQVPQAPQAPSQAPAKAPSQARPQSHLPALSRDGYIKLPAWVKTHRDWYVYEAQLKAAEKAEADRVAAEQEAAREKVPVESKPTKVQPAAVKQATAATKPKSSSLLKEIAEQQMNDAAKQATAATRPKTSNLLKEIAEQQRNEVALKSTAPFGGRSLGSLTGAEQSRRFMEELRRQEEQKPKPGTAAWKYHEVWKKTFASDAFEKQAQKDAEVDALLERAKNAHMLSPEDRAVRERFRRCRMFDEYERARVLADPAVKERVKNAIAEERVREVEARLAREERYDEEVRLKKQKEEAARLKAQQEDIEQQLQDEASKQHERAEAKKQEEEELRKALEEKAKLSEPELVKKPELIRPLDSGWEDKLAKEMATKNRHHIVAKTVDGTDISRKDFGTLLPQEGTEDDPSGWLNDEIVNGFIGAIVQRKLEKARYVKSAKTVPPYAAFSSAWYTNYRKRGGIENIATWSRRKQIKGEKLLSCEKIFFPINTGAHWMLLIISPKARTIEFLDSLNGRGGAKWFGVAREWLEMELGDKYDATEWKDLSSSSAQQQNTNDCGVFTCFNALATAQGMDFSEVGKGSMDDARMMIGAILMNNGFTGDYEF